MDSTGELSQLQKYKHNMFFFHMWSLDFIEVLKIMYEIKVEMTLSRGTKGFTKQGKVVIWQEYVQSTLHISMKGPLCNSVLCTMNIYHCKLILKCLKYMNNKTPK